VQLARSCAKGAKDVVGVVKGVDSRAGGVRGRTIATICSEFHKPPLGVRPPGATRLRTPMVLSTHGSGRARCERAGRGRGWAQIATILSLAPSFSLTVMDLILNVRPRIAALRREETLIGVLDTSFSAGPYEASLRI